MISPISSALDTRTDGGGVLLGILRLEKHIDHGHQVILVSIADQSKATGELKPSGPLAKSPAYKQSRRGKGHTHDGEQIRQALALPGNLVQSIDNNALALDVRGRHGISLGNHGHSVVCRHVVFRDAPRTIMELAGVGGK